MRTVSYKFQKCQVRVLSGEVFQIEPGTYDVSIADLVSIEVADNRYIDMIPKAEFQRLHESKQAIAV